jgi:hypothetical protein
MSATTSAIVPGDARPKVLLDTNVVRDLFDPVKAFTADELRDARERIARRSARDEVRLIVSAPRAWELGKFYDDGAGDYREMIGFVVTRAHDG